ncbi:hypothetical protein R6Q59_035550 [Mikania micrantha]
MTTDATPEIFISRKNRNATGIRDPMMLNSIPKSTPAKVSVLYYLTRNGHIEHPHLIDVPRSSLDGLYLRDVINTLNNHRGKGMANMYSWSFKRSYKNGYVWHDLSADDLIQVPNGHDYVLKGSELLQTHPPETNHSGDDCSAAAAASVIRRRRNQSWSSFDNPQEYMVVKCESSRELAATQTVSLPSPPPSNSSSEEVSVRATVEDQHDGSGRKKASQVLMHLIACGGLKMQAG